jgi:hypothetical protein
MGISNIMAIIRFIIGDLNNKELAYKIEEFRDGSGIGMENLTL